MDHYCKQRPAREGVGEKHTRCLITLHTDRLALKTAAPLHSGRGRGRSVPRFRSEPCRGRRRNTRSSPGVLGEPGEHDRCGVPTKTSLARATAPRPRADQVRRPASLIYGVGGRPVHLLHTNEARTRSADPARACRGRTFCAGELGLISGGRESFGRLAASTDAEQKAVLRALNAKKQTQRQLYAVDHSARESMKSAASCVN